MNEESGRCIEKEISWSKGKIPKIGDLGRFSAKFGDFKILHTEFARLYPSSESAQGRTGFDRKRVAGYNIFYNEKLHTFVQEQKGETKHYVRRWA